MCALAALALAQAAGCGPAVEPPRNLIVISIDTLRADHMSLHGYERPTTPRIDAFAQRAATFDRAIAPWPKTVPSMTSMFTSRYPHNTGIMFGSRGQYIPDEQLMLAEIAKANGLNTAAILTNGVLGSATNFNQGFDTYIETYKEDSPLGLESRNTADTVTLYAQLQLRKQAAAGPFFLWVHYVDPHARYNPPEEYAAPFMVDEHYDPTKLRLNEDNNNFHGGVAGKYWQRNDGQEERGWYYAQYDGEIAYTDYQIGLLFDEMQRLGLFENTTVMITADHGESLGEHQYFFEHGWFPYHACGWVPWVAYWPEMPNPGSRVAYPTSLLNLVPTIAEVMGWNVEGAGFHGRSVVPVIAQDAAYAAPYVVQGGGEGGLRPHQFTRAIQDGEWKLVYTPSARYQALQQGVEYELYNVIEDPDETSNVAEDHPDVVERLRVELQEIIAATGPIAGPPGREPRYTEAELESLRALGYIR